MNKNLPAKIKKMRELLGKATPDCSCGLPTCLGCKADWDVSVEARNSLPLLIEALREFISLTEDVSAHCQCPNDRFGTKDLLEKYSITDSEGG